MVVVVDWIGLFCLISLSFCLVLLPFSVAWCGLQRSPVMVLNILWVRHPLTEKKLNLRHWPDSSFFFFFLFFTFQLLTICCKWRWNRQGHQHPSTGDDDFGLLGISLMQRNSLQHHCSLCWNLNAFCVLGLPGCVILEIKIPFFFHLEL